jgi:hypothetical protein
MERGLLAVMGLPGLWNQEECFRMAHLVEQAGPRLLAPRPFERRLRSLRQLLDPLVALLQ